MDQELRQHLLELLAGKSAHIDPETALLDFPVELRNERPPGSPHTAWELLEHIRIAQWDILEFSRNPDHVSPEFPAGYWNKKAADAEDWNRSVRQVLDDLEAMRDLITDPDTDLFARIPGGTGQTVLREALLVADHNAYHLGQIVLLQRILENGDG
ncbi:MAG: DinB family protein [Pyrinomonadaceae bacterium]